MAPKKSKGSGSSATPIPDEARARAVYKQLSEKKKWIEAVKSDAQSSDFIHCLARTRVLLDKQPEYDSKDKEKEKEKAAFLKVALEVYTKLPDGCEQPPGQQLSSLGMLIARAKLLQLLTEEQQLKTEQQIDGLAYLAQQISKGFTRDGWHKIWFDPRSDQLKEEDKARGNMVAAAAAAAEQLSDAVQAYATVFLKHVHPISEKDQGVKAAAGKLPALTDLKQPWSAEANAAKAAAAAAKAAEPTVKQQESKKALQRESKQQELQQQLQQRDQRRAGGRDAERARDVKRGKAAQEDKQQQLELEAARKKEEEARDDAAKVLDYLEKRLLPSGSSSSSTPEQHMARLQEESRVSLEVLRKTISSLGSRDAKDKDKQELPQELQWCRQQLESTNPSDHVLKQQLQQLQEKGPAAWLVFHDDTAASKAGGGGDAARSLYDSWHDFEEHVVATHLVAAPRDMPLAFADEADEQLVSDTYKLKGLMQPPLADAAADATRLGIVDSSSPWLKAFEAECPLQRFTRTMLLLNTEENFGSVPAAPTEESLRMNTALGFALLQAERKQVAVDRLQQSRSPAWAVQAYHSLRLLPAVCAEIDPDRDHFIIYHYWQSKQASSGDYQRILRPHLHADAAADGGSDGAASFSDGLAEDNATMLCMLHRDGLLSGPLLLALQLYLNKAVGSCLDLRSGSSAVGDGKAKVKRQNSSSSGAAALDAAAALSVLTQLTEQQQLELRLFLLKALCSCYASLSAYVEFVQQEQQQRRRPEQVPVQVVAAGGKARDKGELALVLAQDYYEQACVAAAVPEDLHDPCCVKHHTLRLQAEAEGRPFSKFDSSTWEEVACSEDDLIIQSDTSVMQRYLLQPARVEELLEQRQLKVGTKEGLKALVDALFSVRKHEHQRKLLAAHAEEPAIKRSNWDKARTDMAIAVQLALHRRQLHALVEADEEHLSDSNNSQWTRHELNQRMRALLMQRNAGTEWVLRMWLHFFKEQLRTLQDEDAGLQEQLRALSDAPEKDKGGKGGSKETPKEKEEQLSRRVQQVSVAVGNAENAVAHVKAALSKVMTESEGYPDLIRAYHSTETCQDNPLVQMLTLMANELLSPSQPNTSCVAAQLAQALQLSRLSLFDLDVWVMGHALTARRRVLSSMWKHSQPRAVLALSTEALKSHLKEGISKRAELELLAAEEELKQTQQQQPHQGKAAGKKKKKKGGAAKPTGPSLLSRIAGSESGDDEEEAAAAAAAAAAKAAAEEEEAAQAAAEEEEEEQQEQDEDSWRVKIDLAKLNYHVQQNNKARTDSRDTDHGSSAAAAAKPAGRGEPAGAASHVRPASAAARGDRAAAVSGDGSAAAARDSDGWGTPDAGDHRGRGGKPFAGLCNRCGQPGHKAEQCTTSGSRVGHSAGSSEGAAGQQSSGSSRPAAAEQGRPASGAARSGAAAAGPRREVKVGNLRLLSEASARPRDELFAHMERCWGGATDYCFAWLDKPQGERALSVFCRLSTPDLDAILQSPDPAALLDDVYAWSRSMRARSLMPPHLLAAGQRAFEEALGPQLRPLLPRDWQRTEKFALIEQQIEAAARRNLSTAERHTFDDAKRRAQDASVDAEAEAADKRAQQETKQQARKQQQQQRPAPPQQQREREGELDHRRSGSGERPSGGERSSSSWGPPAPPPPSAAAAPGDRPAPAKVSFAAASQQAQEQPSAAMQLDAGISMPPALLSEHPGYQQQQQQQPGVPYMGMPGQPAPAGQPWPPGVTPTGQQQQQQLPPHAFGGELQPWMLWHTHGAMRALHELVEDEQMRAQLLEAGVRPAPDMAVAPCLKVAVTRLLKQLLGREEPASENLMKLGDLVNRAFNEGLQPPPPMPSPAPQPAPVAALLPHLQRKYQQQQQQQQPPASAHMLPPYLQHHHAPQQQQQQPLWQAAQQQQAAGGDDSDDDDLMNILTGSSSGAAAGAQQQSAWGGAAGAQQQHGGPAVGSEFPSLGVERGSGGGHGSMPGVSNAGLANETGEYNCFLNVVVQCLYNCRDFRNSVWELPAYEAEHPVVVALRKLFMDMQQAESGWQPGGQRAVVNPTALREALDSVTQFKQQEMNDANELLDTLYECFKKAQSSAGAEGSRGVLVDSVFGLRVSEQVNCRQPGCGKRTHIIGAHWEHLLVVNTMALTFAAYGIPEGSADMGRLLRTLFDQEQKMCDKDMGGCGTAYPPERSCEAAPRVLTLQLVWNQAVASAEIEGALQHVQETVDVNPLYAGGCEVADTTYQLSSAVAYYGQHYMAFVHNTKLNTWLLFDDASVSVVGSWQDVIKKCTAGKIQPSVLFYQTVDLLAVGTGARLPAGQGMLQLPHAPMPMGMPAGMAAAAAAAGGPGGAPWARPAAVATPAGVPPHLAMQAHLQQQQQPHQLYQQPHMQQQPMPAGLYSQPAPQQPQQQQQQQPQHGGAFGGSAGWPAAAPAGQAGNRTAAADGSGQGGGWHTVQQPADAGAAWGGAPASAAPAAAPSHPAAGGGGAPAAQQSAAAAPQSPAKVAWGGGAARGGGSMAAAAIRDATGQAGRPGGPSAAPGAGRSGGGPRTTGPPAAGGRGEGPYGGRGHTGRGRG